MKVRVAIVDDEAAFLESIEKIVRLFPSKITYEIDTTIHSLDKRLSDCIYDLYLLDIDMPELDGIGLSHQISAINPKAVFIFISSHENLVFDVFMASPFFFIRKKYLQEDLQKALDKFNKQYIDSHKTYFYDNKGKTMAISYENIYYFEVYGNTLYIHTVNGTYKERKSLKRIIKEIDSPIFLQIHASFYINLEQVDYQENHDFVMKNQEHVPINKKKFKEIRAKYIDYLLYKRGKPL